MRKKGYNKENWLLIGVEVVGFVGIGQKIVHAGGNRIDGFLLGDGELCVFVVEESDFPLGKKEEKLS